jgi:type IV pilus assembly protein PilO
MELSLTKLPWYGQIGAFAVLSALAVFGFYKFYVADVQTDIDARQTRLNTLRSDINKGLATAQKLPEFQAQVKELELRLEALRQVLPEQKDVADVLRRMQTLANQSNLTIRTYAPQPVAKKQLYSEVPYKLQVEGTYHNLGFFLDRISKFPRIINVSDVKITATPKQDANTTITAECVATTFVLLENPLPAAPGAPGARGAPPPATR